MRWATRVGALLLLADLARADGTMAFNASDATCYAARYLDLRMACRNYGNPCTIAELQAHYRDSGRAERRTYGCPKLCVFSPPPLPEILNSLEPYHTDFCGVFDDVNISLHLPAAALHPSDGCGDFEKAFPWPELLEQPCVVYGIGIANDSAFETLLAGRCEVHAFDCTVPADFPSVRNKNFTFHPVCIGHTRGISSTVYGQNAQNESLLRFESLQNVMRRLGHRKVDVMKIDIEGAEWQLLHQLFSSASLPDLLLFELHTEDANQAAVPPDLVARKGKVAVNRLFAKLEQLGYRVFWKETNKGDPACSEFSLLQHRSTLARRLLQEQGRTLRRRHSHAVAPWASCRPYPSSNPDQQCRWTHIRVGGKTAKMCVHSQGDAVSDSVADKGFWPDCRILKKLWAEKQRLGSLYVEIGANIGACVMHMLLATDVPEIIAFEPNPRNLFCLTMTLLELSPEDRERVTVWPVALGARAHSSTIAGARDNQGNSVVGAIVRDRPSQVFDTPVAIAVERYDRLVHGRAVALMKMDAQGFECNVVRGMGAEFDAVAVLKTEIADHWLSAQEGCSEQVLFNLFRERHRTVMTERGEVLSGPMAAPQDWLNTNAASHWFYDVVVRQRQPLRAV